MAATPTEMPHIVTDPYVYGGRPIIEGHRIAVIDVAVWMQQGMTPVQIAKEFDLTLAQVHAALAYYYDHQAELDARLEADERMLAEYAAKDTSPIMQRLREEGARIREERAAKAEL
jgi:uncharacterized protein (DUF433 family)